jgi:hypothetical protein
MILESIEAKLTEKAFKERHKVMQLQWQKAELEKFIQEQKRKDASGNNERAV